jgi:hypothetical protein
MDQLEEVEFKLNGRYRCKQLHWPSSSVRILHRNFNANSRLLCRFLIRKFLAKRPKASIIPLLKVETLQSGIIVDIYSF